MVENMGASELVVDSNIQGASTETWHSGWPYKLAIDDNFYTFRRPASKVGSK